MNPSSLYQGVRRLLITSHNMIGCMLEWKYIVIGCDLAVVIAIVVIATIPKSLGSTQLRWSAAAMESFYKEIKYFLQISVYHTLTITSSKPESRKAVIRNASIKYTIKGKSHSVK